MKNNHTQLKRLAAISLCLVMCLSALPMFAPSAAAAPVAVSNDRIGDRVVFEQDYSELYHVPDNMVLAEDVAPFKVQGLTLQYDYDAKAVDLNATNGRTGRLIVGGLSPAMVTNYSVSFTMSRSNQNSVVYLQAGDAFIAIKQIYVISGEVLGQMFEITSYYHVDNGTRLSSKYTTSLEDNRAGNVNISIHQDNAARINTIYYNGMSVMTTPTHRSASNPTAYGTYSAPSLIMYTSNPEEGGYVNVKLHSIRQTVPEYSLVTPISDPMSMPFGIDGPHPYDTVDDGLALMEQYGFTGTIWIEFLDLAKYSEENLTKLRHLFDNGWEMGIHFSGRLTDLTMEDAIAHMNTQYAQAIDMFGRPPTSFCSLQNADNKSHADYAFANLGLVWRNGPNHILSSNIRNLMDLTWDGFWAPVSSAGAVFFTFTHELDPEPAKMYSIGLTNFSAFLSNYAAAGVRLVPWYDYWTIAQNTYHTQVSDLSIENGKALSFAIDNIGGKSRLFVAAPFAEVVVDGDGNEVPFEQVDGGIIMEVEAGEYQVMTKSAYREDQIDRAMSPLYAAIPVVVMLAVVGSLITMVGRLKF